MDGRRTNGQGSPSRPWEWSWCPHVEEYGGRLAGSRSRGHEIVDVLIENPYLTVRRVMNRLDVTQQWAANLVRQLEGVGILYPMEPAKFGRRRWVAHGILDAIG
jgi:hypothetical protein